MTKPKPRFVYRVTGSWPFPLDMLRYDHATPASENDARLMTSAVENGDAGRIAIDLVSERGTDPNAARWKSQGWEVHPSYREHTI